MKKLALPLVAALAVGACATSPTETSDPASMPPSSASVSPAAPLATQGPDDIADSLTETTSGMAVMLNTWVAFELDGSPADWSFAFSNPSLVEFHADGVRSYEGDYRGVRFAGVRTVEVGSTTITATNLDGTIVTLELNVFN